MGKKSILAISILIIGILAVGTVAFLLRAPTTIRPTQMPTSLWNYNVDFIYNETSLTPVWMVRSARVTAVNQMQFNVTIRSVTLLVQETTFPDGKFVQVDKQIGTYPMVSGFNPPYNSTAMPGFSLWVVNTNASAWPTFAQQPISLSLQLNYTVVELAKTESILLTVAPRPGFMTPNGPASVSKLGEGIGCYGTGFKGSIFPDTYFEWDAVHNSTIDVGSMIRLSEPPNVSYFAPNFAIFVKAAHWYPQPELPQDSLGLFGVFNQLQPSQITTPLTWGAEVRLYGISGEISYSYIIEPTTPIVPQNWYNLRIVVKGDQHLFFVNGQKIATIIAHADYGQRTAFGVMMGGYSYACFGNWYVKDRSPSG